MQTTLRIAIPADSPISRRPTLGVTGSFHFWNSAQRIFGFWEGRTYVEERDIHPRAQCIRVVLEKQKEPLLSPMVPPTKPLDLTAWNFGFCKTTRKHNFEAAKARAQELKQSNDGRLRIIDRPGFVFVFEPPAAPHSELKSVLWATSRDVRASDIRRVLQEKCRA